VLYKLAAAVQCGHIALGTYRASLPPGHPALVGLEARFGRAISDERSWLDGFFGRFPDADLAARLYQAAATVQVAADIADRLPGPVAPRRRRSWRECSRRAPPGALSAREGASRGSGAGRGSARAAPSEAEEVLVRLERLRLRWPAPPKR